MALLASLVAGCSQAPVDRQDDALPAVRAGQVALCHTGDAQGYTLLIDSLNSLTTHLRHGDGVPAGSVPGRAGLVFTATCTPSADGDAGPCPAGMAHLDGFCIDRWEAHLQGRSPYDVAVAGAAQTLPGVVPQAYISGAVAEASCQAVGKRLCTSGEWLRACRGPDGWTFPYGTRYVAGACNEGRTQHPVIEVFGDATDWSPRQMNDPRLNQLPLSLDVAGGHAACMTPEGLFDLHGNLHEWVADADGTFRGGFYVDAEINGTGCAYRTTAHGRTYHDYSTGFRCCAAAR